MIQSRRQFLAAGLGAIATIAPHGVSVGNRWAHEQPRVVIVGAGLAGLACADLLRRHRVDARIYEARSDRVGGRCWTSRHWADGQVAEHGGEFIDTRHTRMLRLAERFGLTLDDTFDTSGKPRLFLQGRRRRRFQFADDMRVFDRRIVRLASRVGRYDYRHSSELAREIDEMTALEVVEQYMPGGSRSPAGLAYHCYLAGFLGLDLHDLGGLGVVDDRSSDLRGADERWHIHGGNDQIVDGLASSLRPGSIRMDSPLEAVARRPNGTFALRVGGSSRPIVADHVVFCMPFTALRDVDLDDAGLSRRKRRCIDELGMGTNAKVIMQFDQRPQEFGNWNGFLTADRPVFQTWESSAGQPGTKGLITVYYGGRSGSIGLPADVVHGPASRRTAEDVLSQLHRGGRTHLPGLRDAFMGRAVIDHWSADRWTRGSYAAYLPGQYTRFNGFVGKPEGALHFAGEHTSPLANQGYLEGAVRTGERAALEVLGDLR